MFYTVFYLIQLVSSERRFLMNGPKTIETCLAWSLQAELSTLPMQPRGMSTVKAFSVSCGPRSAISLYWVQTSTRRSSGSDTRWLCRRAAAAIPKHE